MYNARHTPTPLSMDWGYLIWLYGILIFFNFTIQYKERKFEISIKLSRAKIDFFFHFFFFKWSICTYINEG